MERDQAWLEGIVRGHELIITASRIALLNTTRPEFKDFAMNVVQSRSVQRARFWDWLMLWSPDHRDAHLLSTGPGSGGQRPG